MSSILGSCRLQEPSLGVLKPHYQSPLQPLCMSLVPMQVAATLTREGPEKGMVDIDAWAGG